MAQQKQEYSLTTAFNLNPLVTPEQRAARRAARQASSNRNKQNQRAIASWHASVRGCGNRSEVPFPKRGNEKK